MNVMTFCTYIYIVGITIIYIYLDVKNNRFIFSEALIIMFYFFKYKFTMSVLSQACRFNVNGY